MNVLAKPDIMESVIVKGDLAKLTPDERVRYYGEVCHSLGLNPLTQPLAYMNLSGRMVLYATRNGADQLRKIHNVSLEIVSRQVVNNILTVHCRARLPDGRTDEDYGSVWYPDTLQGEARANAELKAVTKSKRRTTLSIIGLGWLTEEEIEDIPVVAHRRPPPPAPNAMLQHDPETGAIEFEDMAREAAMHGEAAFKAFYKTRSPDERKQLSAMGDELRGLMTGEQGTDDAATGNASAVDGDSAATQPPPSSLSSTTQKQKGDPTR